MPATTLKIRDPIHRFISLNSEHVNLVNTSIFQRLRRIRQLAWANLVYPGAMHTRFSHTLGVFHIASLMAEELGLSRDGERSDERHLVECAALLHDLGHGPFSHVSESVLEHFADRDKIQGAKSSDKIHELLTGDIIKQDEQINHFLAPYGEKDHWLACGWTRPA